MYIYIYTHVRLGILEKKGFIHTIDVCTSLLKTTDYNVMTERHEQDHFSFSFLLLCFPVFFINRIEYDCEKIEIVIGTYFDCHLSDIREFN